eukprot:scaffold33672_cov70-Phaeocystis_antarctica.AAC.4
MGYLLGGTRHEAKATDAHGGEPLHDEEEELRREAQQRRWLAVVCIGRLCDRLPVRVVVHTKSFAFVFLRRLASARSRSRQSRHGAAGVHLEDLVKEGRLEPAGRVDMKRRGALVGGVGHLMQPHAIVDVRESARAVQPNRLLPVDRLGQLALEDEHEACVQGVARPQLQPGSLRPSLPSGLSVGLRARTERARVRPRTPVASREERVAETGHVASRETLPCRVVGRDVRAAEEGCTEALGCRVASRSRVSRREQLGNSWMSRGSWVRCALDEGTTSLTEELPLAIDAAQALGNPRARLAVQEAVTPESPRARAPPTPA